MFQDRLKNIKERLIKEKLDGVLISSVSNITYLTGYANFSQQEREAYLLIGQDFQYIITDGRYSEAIKKQIPHFDLFERSQTSKTEDLLTSLKNKINILAVEEDNLTVSEHKFFRKHFKKMKHRSIDIHRAIKTDDEMDKIQKACKLGDETFNYILKKVKKGISEKELAFEIEYFVKKNGAEISFPSIVAFGKNSSVPHHQTGDKRLTINDKLILLDFGAKVEGYCSDMTRTVFFGQPNDKQKQIYETVLAAQKRAVDFVNSKIKSGKVIKAFKVDKIARDFIIQKGYPSIPHSLGHGIGLEVHEHPNLSPKSKGHLQKGMVFSIEPGMYIPEFGGVRIEDLFVSESSGLKRLTNSPKKLIII